MATPELIVRPWFHCASFCLHLRSQYDILRHILNLRDACVQCTFGGNNVIPRMSYIQI